MVLLAVVVLQIVERMMIVTPGTNDDTRIRLAVEVLEAMKSWSNLVGDNPLEMICGVNLKNFSEVKMGVVDQASM
jgi:hypothetical protein